MAHSVPFWLLGALTDLELLHGLPVAGWDYAVDPIQARTNALTAGLVLGGAWALWHLVPLVQAHRPPAWMAWWAVGTVANRVIIGWLYNNTGKSVFVAVVYHATINLGWQLFPNYVSHCDPRRRARSSRASRLSSRPCGDREHSPDSHAIGRTPRRRDGELQPAVLVPFAESSPHR